VANHEKKIPLLEVATMKIISWNVNGIRAAWGHGLSAFLTKTNADIYAFQETKATEPIPIMELQGYEAYWSFCKGRKGYSGTFCLTKIKPISVTYGLGDEVLDTEGRIITLEYGEFYFVNCYVPNSQRSEERREYRNKWDVAMNLYLQNLQRKKPVIVGGDFNVALSDDDIYSESKRAEQEAEGFLSSERDCLLELIKNGFVDSYRLLHPNEKGKYTWWSNRRFKRNENRGWRIDYMLVGNRLSDKIKESTMCSNVYGSDHCPILLEIDIGSNESRILKAAPTRYKYKDLLKLEENNIPFDRIQCNDLSGVWNSIDWEAAEAHLSQMQTALAKSAYSHKGSLIEKWQRKIVCSLDAKILAVKHVCDSASGRGIDKIKWITPHEKMLAALSLTSKGYQAMPSRLILIRSKTGKERRVHMETYYDRAMQCLYAYALDPVAESWGDRKSFAFRKGRSAYDVDEYIKSGLSGEGAPEWLFIGDVRKCYENISHEWIIEHIPMSERVLREFLKAGYVFSGELFPTNVGVGIGCSTSPIIANMVLDGLQEYVFKNLYPDGVIDYENGNMVRYADDVLFMARTEETARLIKSYVARFLEERGLELSAEKSEIVNVKNGFSFMGRRYEKRGGQLYVSPSEKSIERFMSVLKETICNYAGSQRSLIEKINRKIDGWATYHKVTDADIAFRQMDVYISALLLELCEAKHPKWSREKILERYWYKDANDRYCYALPNKREVRVKFLADTLMIDYFAVKTNVNPYIDIEYVKGRSKEREILNVTGVYRSIWNRQNGRCYYCGHKILRDEEKCLVEANPLETKMASRMAYVHTRCLDGSLDCFDVDTLPSSVTDVMELLLRLEKEQKPISQKYIALSEFFRMCEKNSVTLTFKQIEDISEITLGAVALRKEYWYRTGFTKISQCWLCNGYEIKTLHLEGKLRVVFHKTKENKNTVNLDIPPALKYKRIPNDAKFEIENYFQYIIKKYGL